MIGLVVASQGRLAVEFVAAAQHVLGQPLPQLQALVIDSDKANERDRQRLSDAIARVDSGDGVVVLTDLFEGTASNLALEMLSRFNIEVLGGISLPTLLKLVRARDMPLRSAVAAARDSGRRHIHSSVELRGK
jgi:PTS system mannose-specific IIA component